jgi:hypothetical protein
MGALVDEHGAILGSGLLLAKLIGSTFGRVHSGGFHFDPQLSKKATPAGAIGIAATQDGPISSAKGKDVVEGMSDWKETVP